MENETTTEIKDIIDIEFPTSTETSTESSTSSTSTFIDRPEIPGDFGNEFESDLGGDIMLLEAESESGTTSTTTAYYNMVSLSFFFLIFIIFIIDFLRRVMTKRGQND